MPRPPGPRGWIAPAGAGVVALALVGAGVLRGFTVRAEASGGIGWMDEGGSRAQVERVETRSYSHFDYAHPGYLVALALALAALFVGGLVTVVLVGAADIASTYCPG